MAYQVLARKWRPRTFAEMVGQTHVLRALMNALDTDRLHHAYLFTGTRGVGKTTIARIFAKSLNCETNGVSAHPCGTCRTCTEVDEGRFVDLIEVDAASRTGVDDTRELLDNVQYAPTRGRYKVYLIDEVHMLTRQSFNALLKTLEEPPPHIKFLLATTDPQKLLPTVLSRCLQFNLKRLPLDLIQNHLTHIVTTEQVPFEAPALQLLAQAADGSMRDALSLLDQAIAYGAGQLTLTDVSAMLGTLDQTVVQQLLQALVADDAATVLQHCAQLAEHNPDFNAVLADLLSLLQKIALAQVLPAQFNAELPVEQTILQLAQQLLPEDVQLFYQIALTGRRDLPYAPEPRGGFEMLLLRMLAFRPASAVNVEPSNRPRPASPLAKTIADAKVTASAPASTTVIPPRPAQTPVQPQPAQLKPAPVVNTAPPPVVHNTVAPPVQRAPAPTSPPSKLEAAEVSPEPVVTEPTSNAVHSSLQLDSPESWLVLVEELPLGGMVQQLALNCALQSVEGKTLHLALPANQSAFKSRVVELEKAIAKHLGQAYRIEFHLTDQMETTAANVRQRLQAEHEQQVRAEIAQDPFVQALQQKCNARIGRIQFPKQITKKAE